MFRVTKHCVDCGAEFETARHGHGQKIRCRGCFGTRLRVKQGTSLTNRFTRFKYVAARRGIPVDLTREQWESLISQPCHYCGGDLAPTGYGLDRKHKTDSYTLADVVPCCYDCNRRKRKRSYEKFLSIVGKRSGH
jgi:DNA-directed RNA polymerase subunit RPC12/RpoP